MTKVLVTGGNSRFAKKLKETKSRYNFIYTNKKQFNILNFSSIKKKLKKIKPYCVLHLAGLSRPLSLHQKEISNSIDLNIIGTCNLVKACSDLNIKLIYFSTSYVYNGTKGNYKENDPVLPWSNYGWSKLGGESAVQMYKNSLILRVCMTEKPFLHKKAFINVKTSFIYHEDVAKILFKLLNKKGIINVGGKSQYIYDFAKIENKNVKKIFLKKNDNFGIPKDSSLNLNKLYKTIKK